MVRVGVRRILAGQEARHKGLGEEDGRMDQGVLAVAHHIPLVEAGMRLVVEEGMLRVVGNLDREVAQEDSRRIDREEDHQEEDSDLAVEEGNSLLEEGRLEERRVEDVRIPVGDRGNVLEEDSQPEALQRVNVSLRSNSMMLNKATHEAGVYCMTCLDLFRMCRKMRENMMAMLQNGHRVDVCREMDSRQRGRSCWWLYTSSIQASKATPRRSPRSQKGLVVVPQVQARQCVMIEFQPIKGRQLSNSGPGPTRLSVKAFLAGRDFP